MPKNRDGVTGLPLPSPVTPETTICFQMTIPNASEYRQALRGVLSDLGKYWTWHRQVGTSDEPANEAAELWRQALQTIVYMDECGVVMDCDDIVNCLDENPDFASVLSSYLRDNPEVKEASQQEAQYGTRTLSPQDDATNLIADANCDEDIIYNQIIVLRDYLDSLTMTFFAALEELTNPGERLKLFISSLQAEMNLPIDEILQLLDDALSNIKESYEFYYTDARKLEISCDLRCLTEDSCELRIQDVQLYYINKVQGEIATLNDPMAILNYLSNYILTGNFDSAIAVYTMHALALSVLRSKVPFMGIEFVDLYLLLEANSEDSNDDWRVLCDPCNPPPNCFYFPTNDYDWTSPSEGDAVWVEGFGWTRTTFGPLTIDAPQISRSVTSVTITFSRDPLNNSDYERYYVVISNWGGNGNAQTFFYFALSHDNPVTLTTTGAAWVDPRVQIHWGGEGWPLDPVIAVQEVCLTDEE